MHIVYCSVSSKTLDVKANLWIFVLRPISALDIARTKINLTIWPNYQQISMIKIYQKRKRRLDTNRPTRLSPKNKQRRRHVRHVDGGWKKNPSTKKPLPPDKRMQMERGEESGGGGGRGWGGRVAMLELAELAGQEVVKEGLKGGEKRWSRGESEGGNTRERDAVGGLISARRWASERNVRPGPAGRDASIDLGSDLTHPPPAFPPSSATSSRLLRLHHLRARREASPAPFLGVVAERKRDGSAGWSLNRPEKGEGQRWRRMATGAGGSKEDLEVRLAELPLQLRTFTLTSSNSDLFLLH